MYSNNVSWTKGRLPVDSVEPIYTQVGFPETILTSVGSRNCIDLDFNSSCQEKKKKKTLSNQLVCVQAKSQWGEDKNNEKSWLI